MNAKRFVLVIFLCCGVLAGHAAKFSKSGLKEKKFVSLFLGYMDKSTGPKYTEMMKCIAPSFLTKNGISAENAKVDNILHDGFSIESYDVTGLIKAKIWGKNREWVHLLSFQLVKEKGKLYLQPSSYHEPYITPWIEKKEFIREK